MPEDQNKVVVNIEKECVANPKNFTTIPNSSSEFCVFTYKAEHEAYTQILRPGFFNSAALFVNVGDMIRVFRFDETKKLTHFLEFIVMDTDKINRTVTVAAVSNNNLEKKIIE